MNATCSQTVDAEEAARCPQSYTISDDDDAHNLNNKTIYINVLQLDADHGTFQSHCCQSVRTFLRNHPNTVYSRGQDRILIHKR
ncbi:hypothetical protein ABVT39_027429 [Epinephelus coioides]